MLRVCKSINHRVIMLIALIVGVSVWPAGGGLASMILTYDPTPGMITNGSSNMPELLQLAKHGEDDSDEGEHPASQ
jgi:hypothetical protein